MNSPGAGASWPGPALLVPVSVDARVFTESSGDASWSWVTPDYTSAQQFGSPPRLFQGDPPVLIDPDGNAGSTGVVLHWALPDGLTAGGSAAPQTGTVSFPAIPTRWLITRRVSGASASELTWVVASDYLGSLAGTSYFAEGAATTLGQCWTLPDWPGEAGLPPGLSPPLTAVGLGDPSFAAYVPNVQHVLAFYDPLAAVSPGQLSYTVCGWYADQTADPLYGAGYRSTGWQTADEWAALMTGLGWSLGDDQADAETAAQNWATAHGYATDPGSPRTVLPSRTICHGLVCDVTWPGLGQVPDPNGLPVVNRLNENTLPAFTQAHTAIDALAATVANSAGAQGTQVAEALTVLLGGQLPLLEQPDADAQLAMRLQDTWFQRSPGGTRWQLVPDPKQGTPSTAAAVPLTAAQAALLDALNDAQRTLDTTTRQVASLQSDIYALWWKLSYVTANPGASVPLPNAGQVLTTALTAKQQQATTALTGWQAAAQQRDAAEGAMQAGAGPLLLQQVPEPPFLRPNDPVVLVQGVGRSYRYGEDGRFTEDGSLYCRLSGQTLAALLVTGSSTPVTAQLLELPAVTVPDGPAEVTDLIDEAYFLDTGNAHAIAVKANAAAPQPDAVVAAQQTVIWNPAADPTLDQQSVAESAGLQSAFGPVAVPSLIAVNYYLPPWSPLYLDWQATYYPASGWIFPAAAPTSPLAAQTAEWAGTVPADGVTVQGRSVLTPQASDALAARLDQLVAQAGNSPELQPYQADISQATAYLADAAVLSQALSGLNEQLLQRDPALVQQPDLAALGQWLAPANGPAFVPAAAPSPASAVPLSPVRAGFLTLDQLWVVDVFGQYYDVLKTVRANPDFGGEQTGPDVGPAPQPGLLALRPRLTQASRLLLQFTDAGDDTKVTGQSATASPVCGWLIPNRVDNSLSVYDAAGVLQGELLLAQAQAYWLPAPDLAPPGAQTTPPRLADPHLAALVSGVLGATDPVAALGDLLTTIDNASWATAPDGPDAAQLSTLIGFPVAVVRARLLLELARNPAVSQLWADTGTDDDGGIGQALFPVELGSASMDDDGLVGFQLDADPAHLSSHYGPPGSAYVTNAPVTVSIGQPALATLLLHPQGTVHAFTGLLPPVSAALPAQFQLAPVRATEVVFRAGPLLTPPTGVAVPPPAFGQGDWSWLQYDSAAAPALPRALSRPDTAARLPDVAPGLRDGWLRLTLGGQPSRLSYALSPPALAAGHGGAPTGSLTVTAYNASSTPVTCDSITVTLPTGSAAAALTDSPGLITPASGQPDSWTFSAAAGSQPGVFSATPVGSGTTVTPGDTLTFTFTSLSVNPTPGLSVVEILEAADGAQATVTLVLERFAYHESLP